MTREDFEKSLSAEQLDAFNAALLASRAELQANLTAVEQRLVAAHKAQIATLQATCDAATAERNQFREVLGGTEAGAALVKERALAALEASKAKIEAKIGEWNK